MHAARIELAAHPESAVAARAHVAACLHDSPRRDDAMQVVSEFAAETLSHGATGDFVLTVEQEPGRALIELTSREAEAGNKQGAHAESDSAAVAARRFPGLVIAHALSDRLGHRVSAGGDSTLWAEFVW